MNEIGGVEQVERMDAMLRSHVERCLQDVWETGTVEPDELGEYPFQRGTAACWVSVNCAGGPGVAIGACATQGTKRTARLLTELNELNARSRWARVYWERGMVLVEAQVPWTAVDRPTLAVYLEVVSSVACDIGEMVAAVFGGSTPLAGDEFPETQDADDEEDVA